MLQLWKRSKRNGRLGSSVLRKKFFHQAYTFKNGVRHRYCFQQPSNAVSFFTNILPANYCLPFLISNFRKCKSNFPANKQNKINFDINFNRTSTLLGQMLEKVSKMSEIYEKFLLQYANTSFIVEIGYKIASKKQHRLMGDANMRKSRGKLRLPSTRRSYFMGGTVVTQLLDCIVKLSYNLIAEYNYLILQIRIKVEAYTKRGILVRLINVKSLLLEIEILINLYSLMNAKALHATQNM